MTREIPLYTLEGVEDAEISTHYFSTADGLGLSMLRFSRGGDGDAVLVIHGLTTSTDMFVMPEHRNLVSCLLEARRNGATVAPRVRSLPVVSMSIGSFGR